MNKNYLIFLICLLSTTVIGQTSTFYFEGNDMRWAQNTNGLLFNNFVDSEPGLEIPAYSGNESVYTHSFAFSGIDLGGSLHSYFQKFCAEPQVEACESVYGPVKIGGGENLEVDVMGYNRIWFVTQEQIDEHLAYFECVNDPNCDESVDFPLYEIPEDFLTWPAHGDTELGYADYLAPFVDLNNDGHYDAEDGDHPNICGDFSSYFIHNDVGTEESTYFLLTVGLEIHTQVYGFNASEGALHNSLFVRHKIINRSIESYSDSYMGNFTDFDLGNPNDDRIATDVSRSMYYAYNGDSFDDGTFSGPGYGDDLPAVGVKYIGAALTAPDGYDNEHAYGAYETYGDAGIGFGDGIADNERQGLSGTMTYTTGLPSETQEPETPAQYYNFLNSTWNDGTHLTYGGNGYNTGEEISAKYSFDGMSDPYLVGTYFEDPEYDAPDGWTEEAEDFPAGDRRVIAGSGPFTFEAGDTQILDYAFIFARESYDDDLTVVETLQSYADEILGMQCGEIPDVTTGIFDTPKQLNFKAFPNPATDVVNIQLPKTFEHVRVEVLDMQSRVIYSHDLSQIDKGQINLDVAKGQYILRVIADGEVGVSKLTKM